MRVFICGIDGYLGWPLALHLKALGHEVRGVDDLSRRRRVAEVGSESAISIASFEERAKLVKMLRFNIECEGTRLAKALHEFKPDTIVHLAEQPSAPYSMRNVESAMRTQRNNVMGTLQLLYAMRHSCPDAHLVKLGTMGEYGTPNIAIPEGFFEIEYRGRKDTLPFPRQAGSWYHLSKVHDSNNIMFACKLWGLRSTDIMQGVVFGTRIYAMGDESTMATRFDVDECFGTAVNRFCAQAVAGYPLTVYGGGLQRRGFLPLRDSIQCLTLAISKPPQPGEYRVLNQFQEVYSICDLALTVQRVAQGLGLKTTVGALENPRMEAPWHFYQPDHQKLFDLGYKPTLDTEGVIREMLEELLPHRERIMRLAHVFRPKVRWVEGLGE